MILSYIGGARYADRMMNASLTLLTEAAFPKGYTRRHPASAHAPVFCAFPPKVTEKTRRSICKVHPARR
jgi:hypothetical protein